ncbi:MAG: 1,4-dihydroxy-2-naphthoate octaprenyltransferase [Flavobacteriia bacterium]|nr:1,4-dihydroxy-2-naphthoate octaprenyltransferase [Flavobacteriia bacterium]
MTKKQAWIKALRLRTLPLSLSGIILGSFIAYHNGYWNSLIFLFALTTTILFQIVSNLANDLGDTLKGADNNERIGPMRAVQSGLITPKEMKNAVILTSFLSLISALSLIYFGTKNLSQEVLWFYILLAGLSVLAAITYTVGKKAYGYNGFGDIFVFIFFGLVSVLGVYTLYSKTFEWINLLPATAIGLFSTAVLNLNNMRDQVNDQKVGKKTLVVQIGPRNAKLYHSYLILGGIISFLLFNILTTNYKGIIGLFPSIIMFIHLQKVMITTNPADFDPELKKIALSTFAISVLTSIFINM